jgi:hypothetical protein
MKNLFLFSAMGFALGANVAHADCNQPVDQCVADIQVSPCPRDAKILQVQIHGESAVNIFRAFAQRVGMKPADMQNTLSNGMNCEGLKFSADGDVTVAKCSYVMKGQKNIPYPQIDPGFSNEEVIVCE